MERPIIPEEDLALVNLLESRISRGEDLTPRQVNREYKLRSLTRATLRTADATIAYIEEAIAA